MIGSYTPKVPWYLRQAEQSAVEAPRLGCEHKNAHIKTIATAVGCETTEAYCPDCEKVLCKVTDCR